MVEVKLVKVRQALTKSGLPDIDYALNPYAGCQHSCIYCYAREYTKYRDVAENWGRIVVVKKNVVEVLKREARVLKKGVVGVGTITDPYQPIEAQYQLTRSCVEVLLSYGFQVSIQTKSRLVLRDLDIFEQHRDRVDVGITITTLDEKIASVIEPYASRPMERARAVQELASRGVKTWIFLGPILPGLTDDIGMIEDIVRLAKETNSVLYYDKLRVKNFMLKSSGLLRELADRATGYPWHKLFREIEELCRRYGVECRPGMDYSEPRQKPRTTLDAFLRNTSQSMP